MILCTLTYIKLAFLSATSDGLVQKPTSPLIRASNISNIPFLEEPIIFKCDSSGGTYGFSSHGISIQVPQGAIPIGKQVHFELAVTLFGPFHFSNGKRPISPILWLCTHEDITFQKPIQVRLPHFLTGLSDEERVKLEVNFAKAEHPPIGSTEAPLPQVEFKPCMTKTQFVVSENGSYGLLQTTHCCFLCIEAKHSRDLALRAGYCLTRVEYEPSPSRHIVHFCATFQLDTCLDVSILLNAMHMTVIVLLSTFIELCNRLCKSSIVKSIPSSVQILCSKAKMMNQLLQSYSCSIQLSTSPFA